MYDVADEHPDLTYNNWGLPPQPPSDSNTYGTSYFNQGPFKADPSTLWAALMPPTDG